MLLAVDSNQQTYDWQCNQCGTTLRGEPVTQLKQPDGAMVTTCSVCGVIEGFTTTLTADDAAGTMDNFRATQATLIRAAQAL